MFKASFRLNLENEHISVDTALRVRTSQRVIHKIICLYNYILMKDSKNRKPV